MSIFTSSGSAQAQSLNAGAVMNEMNSDQRVGYVSGVIEGLAYSRFVRDKPNETGMQCIYDWYYKDNAKRWKNSLFPVFEKYKDKPVGVILYVLTKKACGA
ncbi:MAG: hypothetical protein GY761_00820 [Hyphomicrobiales bacterium]|nr:hypothetical protein [Hyphomicrobiales bacterium]